MLWENFKSSNNASMQAVIQITTNIVHHNTTSYTKTTHHYTLYRRPFLRTVDHAGSDISLVVRLLYNVRGTVVTRGHCIGNYGVISLLMPTLRYKGVKEQSQRSQIDHCWFLVKSSAQLSRFSWKGLLNSRSLTWQGDLYNKGVKEWFRPWSCYDYSINLGLVPGGKIISWPQYRALGNWKGFTPITSQDTNLQTHVANFINPHCRTNWTRECRIGMILAWCT